MTHGSLIDIGGHLVARKRGHRGWGASAFKRMRAVCKFCHRWRPASGHDPCIRGMALVDYACCSHGSASRTAGYASVRGALHRVVRFPGGITPSVVKAAVQRYARGGKKAGWMLEDDAVGTPLPNGLVRRKQHGRKFFNPARDMPRRLRAQMADS